MSYYALALRRVEPGRFDSYRRAAEEIARGWARERGQLSYRICVDESDADRVLLVGEWPRPDDLDAVFASMPPDLRDAVQQDTASVESGWHWYRPSRSLTLFDEPARFLIVSRFEIAFEDAARFDRWTREHHRIVGEVAGVVSQAHLISLERPTVRADFGEYSSMEARRRVDELLEERPPPTPLLQMTSFVGRLGYRWEPPVG